MMARSAILLEGYMFVLPSKYLPTNRNFSKKRFFELREKGLYYYDTMEGNLMNAIPINHLTYVGVVETDSNEEAIFQVVYKYDSSPVSTLYVKADDTNERRTWISRIDKLCIANFDQWPINKYFHPGIPIRYKYSCCHGFITANGCVSTDIVLNADSLPKDVATPRKLKGRYVRALCYYKSYNDTSISLAKDEIVELINDDDLIWQIRKNNGLEGYVPKQYVAFTDSNGIELFRWFHDLDRNKTGPLLFGTKEPGAFLVRPSSNQSNYILSVLVKEDSDVWKVKNVPIKETHYAPLRYYIQQRKSFPTIPDLIEHYRNGNFPGIIKLKWPPKKTKAILMPSNYSESSLVKMIKASDIKNTETVNVGHFGVVLKALYIQNGLKHFGAIAVKAMKPGVLNEDELIEDLRFIMQIEHPHIVRLVGIVNEESFRFSLVMEYMEEGSLKNYLKTCKSSQINIFISICTQICLGMRHLEELDIIHRDLAARNCLLDRNNVVKITDIGLGFHSKDGIFYHSSENVWTYLWYPPESIRDGKFTSKSDIWSYGVLMWEVFELGAIPYYYTEFKDIEDYYSQICNIDSSNDSDCKTPPPSPNLRLRKPENINSFYELMCKCWENDPTMRPSFGELLESIVTTKD